MPTNGSDRCPGPWGATRPAPGPTHQHNELRHVAVGKAAGGDGAGALAAQLGVARAGAVCASRWVWVRQRAGHMSLGNAGLLGHVVTACRTARCHRLAPRAQAPSLRTVGAGRSGHSHQQGGQCRHLEQRHGGWVGQGAGRGSRVCGRPPTSLAVALVGRGWRRARGGAPPPLQRRPPAAFHSCRPARPAQGGGRVRGGRQGGGGASAHAACGGWGGHRGAQLGRGHRCGPAAPPRAQYR